MSRIDDLLPPERELPAARLRHREEHLVNEIRRSLGENPRTLPRKRLVPVIAAAVLLLSAVGVGAAGRFMNSEFDDGSAVPPARTVEVIDRYAAEVPLPPAGTFDALKQSVAENPAWQDENGIAEMVAFNAACQWYRHWTSTRERGDVAEADRALTTVKELPNWRHLQDVRTLIAKYSNAAAQGDVEAVNYFISVNC